MPQIPIEQYKTNVVGGFTDAVSKPSNAIPQALENVGVAIQKIQERDAVNYTTKAFSDFQIQELQNLENVRKQVPADQLTPEYIKSYDQNLQKLIESAPNDTARELLTKRAYDWKDTQVRQAIKYQVDAKQFQYKQDSVATDANYYNMVMADPTILPQIYNQKKGDLAGKVATGILTDAEAKANADNFLNQSAFSLANNDPLSYRARKEAGDFAEVKPSNLKSYDSLAEQKLKQIEQDKIIAESIANNQANLEKVYGFAKGTATAQDWLDINRQEYDALVSKATSSTGIPNGKEALKKYLEIQTNDLLYNPEKYGFLGGGERQPTFKEATNYLNELKLVAANEPSLASATTKAADKIKPFLAKTIDDDTFGKWSPTIKMIGNYIDDMGLDETKTNEAKTKALQFMNQYMADNPQFDPQNADPKALKKFDANMRETMDQLIKNNVPAYRLLGRNVDRINRGDGSSIIVPTTSTEKAKPVGNVVIPPVENILQQGGYPEPPIDANEPPLVKTKAEYDALPPGASYIESDGKKYRKP